MAVEITPTRQRAASERRTVSQLRVEGGREKRDAARKLIASGANPAFEKKRAAVTASVSAANTFGKIAEEFIANRDREGLQGMANSNNPRH